MITCYVTCPDCGLERHPFEVRERKAGEIPAEYVDHVVGEMVQAHTRKSLLCETKSLVLNIPEWGRHYKGVVDLQEGK